MFSEDCQFFVFGELLNDPRKHGFVKLMRIENSKLVEASSKNFKAVVTNSIVRARDGWVCLLQETSFKIYSLVLENDTWVWTK